MDIRAHAQDAARLSRSRLQNELHGIYAIVNGEGADPVALTKAILAGGCRIVQYRAKSGIDTQHARRIREATRRAGALLLLNDDWRAVYACDADGVHLGPEDATFEDLRAIRAALPERLVGFSCGAPQEAIRAEEAGADYAGVGSVFATGSKSDAGVPIGVEGLRAVTAATALPVAAIGGITADVLPSIRRTGVAMAAILSAIASASDPRAVTAQLVQLWQTS